MRSFVYGDTLFNFCGDFDKVFLAGTLFVIRGDRCNGLDGNPSELLGTVSVVIEY